MRDNRRSGWWRGLLIFAAVGACSSPESASVGGRGGAGGPGGSGLGGGPGSGGSPGGAAGAGGASSPGGAAGAGGGSPGGVAGAGGGSFGGAAGGGAWTLTWSDEFDGLSGQLPDPTKWTYDLGGGGWGNDELENNTQRPENAALDGNGDLVITVRAESYMGSSYTSARLRTQDLFSQAYGRFEARIRIPRGQGLSPAFWMLGTDLATAGWPDCGEIDIMENIGREPAVSHGSLYGPGDAATGIYQLPGGAALADAFHLYAVEWETDVIRFYVDDQLYQTRSSTDLSSPAAWVYDHPFFMILNVAIGGTSPGAPDATTVLPQAMTVDYVRVYAR